MTETKYIAVRTCYIQVLWMKQQLRDYGLKFNIIPMLCDNTNAINLTKNLIQHSRTKYIEIKHHFIRDYVHKGILNLIL